MVVGPVMSYVKTHGGEANWKEAELDRHHKLRGSQRRQVEASLPPSAAFSAGLLKNITERTARLAVFGTFCSRLKIESQAMATAKETMVSLPLPVLPEGWSAEKDFKAIGTPTPAIQRNLEPVGPHFLAHARRVAWPTSAAHGRLS
jgi:hypothetical protein